jgi:hypothetical protein
MTVTTTQRTTQRTTRGAGALGAPPARPQPRTLVWDRDRGALSATQVERIQKRITRRA